MYTSEAMKFLTEHHVGLVFEQNPEDVTAYLEKQANIGKLIAGMIPGAKGGVGKWALLGGLAGGVANAAHRGRQLRNIAKMTPEARAAARSAGRSADASSTAAGRKFSNSGEARSMRDAKAAKKFDRMDLEDQVRRAHPGHAGPKENAFMRHGRAFAPDLARSFASGAASGAVAGAGSKAAINAARRSVIAKKVNKAAPWVAGGTGAAYLLGRD